MGWLVDWGFKSIYPSNGFGVWFGGPGSMAVPWVWCSGEIKGSHKFSCFAMQFGVLLIKHFFSLMLSL